MKRFIPLLLLALAVPLFGAAPAAAEVRQETFRYGPVELGPYEVAQNYTNLAVPKPNRDGFITGMKTDVVDASGAKVPIQRIMLHHIVFATLGKKDQTCENFTLFDSKSQFPAFAERFYAAGEERAEMALPPGYGYRMRANDKWLMPYMLMNHKNKKDTVYIEYTVTYDDSPGMKGAKPIWLDVDNCRADPVFDVPGGGKPGSTFSRSSTWTAPESGHLVGGGGHVHGGARNLTLSQPDCGDRHVFTSEPTWGGPKHPFYNVRPVLHEPGPVNMSGFLTAQGVPVTAGQQLKLTANYDNSRPHTRVMGIMMVYLVPDAGVSNACDRPMPQDIRVYRTNEPGRAAPPMVTVPISGLVNGKARTISKPPGRTFDAKSGDVIRATSNRFSKPNVRIRKGAKLRWKFDAGDLHNVTLANGPRGFSSDNLNDFRSFSYRFKEPGTYRIFCALHPIDMTETVRVTGDGKKKKK